MSTNLDAEIAGLEALIEQISINASPDSNIHHTLEFDDAVFGDADGDVADNTADDGVDIPMGENQDSDNEIVELNVPRVADIPITRNHTFIHALITAEIFITDENVLDAFPLINDVAETVSPELLPPTLVAVSHNIVIEGAKKKSKNEKDTANTIPEESPKIVPHAACARCSRQPSPTSELNPITLETCSRCMSVEYCSEKCQSEDWDAHKNIYCINPWVVPIKMLGKPFKTRILRTYVVNPFARLAKGIWLHDRHKLDVFALLIDCFRLRESDDWHYGRMLSYQSVYSGKTSPCPPFHCFLDVAEAKNLLPPWWSEVKRVECLQMALDRSDDNFHDLYAMARDVEFLVAYGDAMILMQMRMFAEEVYGNGPARTDGRLLKQKMAAVEAKARNACK